MTDTDFASGGGDDAFTAEEQAAFDAYASGSDAPAEPVSEPAGGDAPTAAAAAPEAPAPAAEPAAAPGEVVDPDAADADDPEANRGRFVRHGAFHKEREGRKAAQREAADLREQMVRGNERLRVLMEAWQNAPQAQAAQPAPKAEPEAPIDPREDIFGAYAQIKAEMDAIRSGQQQMTDAQRQERETAEASRREEAEVRSVVADYQSDVRRVAQAEPHFADAYRHLMAGRIEELKLMGLGEADAAKQVEADELAIVRSARQRGVSPAETMFALAKSRGFVAKAPEPAPAATPAETPAEKAKRIGQGQAAAKSLSAASGGPAGEVTLEMLGSMSERDFEAFAAKNPRKLAALMGA